MKTTLDIKALSLSSHHFSILKLSSLFFYFFFISCLSMPCRFLFSVVCDTCKICYSCFITYFNHWSLALCPKLHLVTFFLIALCVVQRLLLTYLLSHMSMFSIGTTSLEGGNRHDYTLRFKIVPRNVVRYLLNTYLANRILVFHLSSRLTGCSFLPVPDKYFVTLKMSHFYIVYISVCVVSDHEFGFPFMNLQSVILFSFYAQFVQLFFHFLYSLCAQNISSANIKYPRIGWKSRAIPCRKNISIWTVQHR